MKYIIALDQGTTSSRAVVFDQNGELVASHGIEFEQLYPKPGWVEHRPQDILSSQIDALKSGQENLLKNAQNLFAKVYEQAQGQAGPQDFGGQGFDSQNFGGQAPQGGSNPDDDVIDADFKEV